MQETVTIRLERAICSAALVDGGVGSESSGEFGSAEVIAVGADQSVLSQVRGALEDAIRRVNEFHEQLVREHKCEIAKLSVEIARKVLAHKIAGGDYEIENIVKEALESAPTREDVVLHLNPADAASYEKVLEGESSAINVVADVSVGRAECLLETPKGRIESMIDEHLKRIGEALEKVD